MTLTQKKWFRFIPIFVVCSIAWIVFNIAYNTTELNAINTLDDLYLLALNLGWYAVLYALSFWCLKRYQMSNYFRFIASYFVAIALYFACGSTVLISHLLLGFSL